MTKLSYINDCVQKMLKTIYNVIITHIRKYAVILTVVTYIQVKSIKASTYNVILTV